MVENDRMGITSMNTGVGATDDVIVTEDKAPYTGLKAARRRVRDDALIRCGRALPCMSSTASREVNVQNVG